MKLIFSTHAAEQLAHRTKAKVLTTTQYNIAHMGFVFSGMGGTDYNSNTAVEYWIYPNNNDRLLLVVNAKSRVILTVLHEWRGVVPAAYNHYNRNNMKVN